MDTFLNMIAKPDSNDQGSQEVRPSNPGVDHDSAVQAAQQHGGHSDSSLFSSAVGFLNNNKDEHEKPLDEADVQQAHQKAYQDNSAGDLSASSLGSAAALQALKQFTSGGGGGGGSQSALIGMAMSEASNLFDKSGGAASGSKQDAINGAAMTVMKLVVQSKFSGGSVGGGNSGGLGSLMGMASKFM